MQGLEQVRAWTEQSAGIFTARCREASDTLGIICEEVCLHPWSLMRRGHSLAVLNPDTSLPPCSKLGISWENGRGGCVSEVGSMSQSCIRLQEITELQRSRHACKFVSLKNNVYCIFFLYVCCLIKITILKVAAYVGVCFSYTPGVPLQKFSWLCTHTRANRKVSCVYHPLKHKTLTNVWLKTKYISNPTGKTQLTWRSLFTWDTSGERQEGQASP